MTFRYRNIAIVVSAVLFVITFGQGRGGDDDCAQWTIHGYAIGMSKAAASDTRPFEPAAKLFRKGIEKSRPGYEAFQADVKKHVDSLIVFDERQRLVEYVATFTPKAAPNRTSLEAALTEKLGSPAADDDYAKFWSQWNNPWGYGTSQSTVWISESCDSVIQLVHLFRDRLQVCRFLY